jgi:hypothetical protein
MGSSANIQKVLLLVALTALLVGCGATKNDGTSLSTVSASSRMRTPVEGSSINSGCDFNPCVALTAQNENMFTQAIRGLLDSGDFGQVGDIPMSGGASIALSLDFQAGIRPNIRNNSAVVPGTARMQLVIRDRIQNRPTEPIQISFDGSFGDITVYGEIEDDVVDVTFVDEYGAIWINGQIQGNTFNGTLNYINNHSFSSYTPASSQGVLRFSVPTCQVFNCVN